MNTGLNTDGSLLNTLNHFGISFKEKIDPRDYYAFLLMSDTAKQTRDNCAHFKTIDSKCFIRRNIGSF